MNLTNIGVSATIYLSLSDTIEDLAKKLGDDLSLPEFSIDTDQDSPHEMFAMTETLGIEIWLNKSQKHEAFNYVLELESQFNVEDSFNSELSDISFWLSKHISLVSNIMTGALVSSNLHIFENGISMK